jgi:hypothetical protein
MKKLTIASLDSSNFSFQALGETKEQARQTLINGLHIHAEQYKIDRNWWVDYGMNLEAIEVGKAYRDHEEIPSTLDAFDPKDMSFTHEGTAITNPTVSECGRFIVSPEDYGFSVVHTGGGCTAWEKRVRNGWVVITDGDVSHILGEVGSSMLMGFYDGSEGDDTECLWGNHIAHIDLQVGISTTTDDEIDDIADKAVNALALSIQNDLGVMDGDLASMYFSDDEVKEWAKSYIKAELKARIDNAKAKAE